MHRPQGPEHIVKLNVCLRGDTLSPCFNAFLGWDWHEPGEKRARCLSLSTTTVAFTKDQRSEQGDILRVSDKYMYMRGPRALNS